MIQSMTGYGSAERGEFRVEIRSLNHRFIDINIRMPSDLLKYEIPLRNIIKERFSRGKFDVTVSIIQGRHVKIIPDIERARSIYNALKELKRELSLSGDIGIDIMTNFREMILREDFEYNINLLFDVFKEALDNLINMRLEEGKSLMNDLQSRIDSIARMKDSLTSVSSELIISMKERLIERVKSLLGDIKIDEGRILQEVAILTEKADISEEITRIDSHLRQMKKLLSEGDTIGRRLDFILQELFREVNTISSKSSDYRVSSIVVEMRAEIERLREQSQNIQ
ncbi:MAG: YicC/YloC family endoribonuclease [Thermodesulfovibrionales bacterium]